MMQKKIIIFFGLLLGTFFTYAQQTIGLFENDEAAFNGYTLFAPSAFNATYLIDNCGRQVHSWSGTSIPGSVSYLLENGDLLRAVRAGGSFFSGGGIGGRVERVSWEGDLIWQYDYATMDVHQHHDIAYLPNGNVLILAWELKSVNEAIANGRNPALLGDGLWPDHIVEVEPVGLNGGNIVWEWHFWDHLIQDFDSSKQNYGVVADHPELLDINYIGNNAGDERDWIHCNAIAYNSDRDEIIISSRHLSEFYIIDHSTTTAEAAGHSGGNAGKGGDFLYRWGNPAAYQRGTVADQKCFGQHDVSWIEPGLENAGSVMFFNNGLARPGGSYSSVDIVEPPIDTDGNYILEAGQSYGPTDLVWTYEANPTAEFFSPIVSGAQRLPNGNTLICEGAEGRFFEVDAAGNQHWEYICPVGPGGPLPQGSGAIFNAVFRAYRYGPDYGAFNGRDLTPGSEIEINPLPSNCMITTSVSDLETKNISVYPNPFDDYLIVETEVKLTGKVRVINSLGKIVFSTFMNGDQVSLVFPKLASGLYLLQLPNGQSIKLLKKP